MGLKTPVVLLTFNRPSLTARVLEAVARVEPERLIVVSDGPRSTQSSDIAKVDAVRALFADIPWRCEVTRDYAPANLGLKRRVSSGLTAAFAEVERAIILEDDCVPSPDFFPFCEEILDRYADDPRVMSVCGTNFMAGRRFGDASYFFSHRHHIWGWATWRRAWQHFDADMRGWPAFRAMGGMTAMTDDPYEESYWTAQFQSAFDGTMETWGYPWAFACLAQSALCIRPNMNLVTNIGGETDPTHPAYSPRLHDLPFEPLGPLTHPPFVVRNKAADMWEFDWAFHGRELRARFGRKTGWRALWPRLRRALSGGA